MENSFGEKLIKLNQDIKSHLKHSSEKFKLVIVTKSQENREISEVIKLGYKVFGENYVDEALKKMEHFKNYDFPRPRRGKKKLTQSYSKKQNGNIFCQFADIAKSRVERTLTRTLVWK